MGIIFSLGVPGGNSNCTISCSRNNSNQIKSNQIDTVKAPPGSSGSEMLYFQIDTPIIYARLLETRDSNSTVLFTKQDHKTSG
jgi:hypothetical protein